MVPGEDSDWIGIDYGSKMAGTTVVCWQKGGQLLLAGCQKEQDADRFILDLISKLQPQSVFIDAPLSLPGVYRGMPGFTDYFYRQCDRETQAMSPMFLGGLTARAMQMRSTLTVRGISTIEAYPGGLARLWNLKNQGYKQEISRIESCLEEIGKRVKIQVRKEQVPSWHALDAILAWIIGLRYQGKHAILLGDGKEGVIYY